MVKSIFPNKDTVIVSGSIGKDIKNGNFGQLSYLPLMGNYSIDDNSNKVYLSRMLIEFGFEGVYELDKAILKLTNYMDSNDAGSVDLEIYPLTKEWDEGDGNLWLDEKYLSGSYATWKQAQTGSLWGLPGGDYDANYKIEYHMGSRMNDIEVDITNIASQIISGTIANYGFLIKLKNESDKTFMGVLSKDTLNALYFPRIELHYSDVLTDDRNWFDSTTSNKLYCFNRVNGTLKSLTDSPYVKIMDSGSVAFSGSTKEIETGIYEFITEPFDINNIDLNDYWYLDDEVVFTGSIDINKSNLSSTLNSISGYVVSMPNLKKEYKRIDENFYLDVNITETLEDMQHVYTKYNVNTIVSSNANWELYDVLTEEVIIEAGESTKLSNDSTINFFRFNTTGIPYNRLLSFRIFIDGNMIGDKFFFSVSE